VPKLKASTNKINHLQEKSSKSGELMFKATKKGYLNAVKILESLVLKGVPFRDVHYRVGKMVLEAMETDKDKGV
jgi:argininosuccinate lyase